MKTIKLTQKAWEIITMWKFELKTKTLSQALIEKDKLHLKALEIIGELLNDKSKK